MITRAIGLIVLFLAFLIGWFAVDGIRGKSALGPPVSSETNVVDIKGAHFYADTPTNEVSSNEVWSVTRRASNDGFMWGATYGMRYHENSTNVLAGLTNNPIK